jgi:signal recognition particle receptor subunit beta
MVFFNYALRKLNAKIVYYGPGLCGKTTNLQWIHDHFEGGQRGKMISLATEGDRTIFFDLLPIDIGSIRGMDVTLQLYTVPGQVHYNSTRQLVLRGADGVVFVADSQRTMKSSNVESFGNLQENLMLQGIDLKEFPHILQFNKRDLRDLLSIEDLNESLNVFSTPIFEAIATEGIGVQESLEGIVKLVMRNLREKYEPVASATGPHAPATIQVTGPRAFEPPADETEPPKTDPLASDFVSEVVPPPAVDQGDVSTPAFAATPIEAPEAVEPASDEVQDVGSDLGSAAFQEEDEIATVVYESGDEEIVAEEAEFEGPDFGAETSDFIPNEDAAANEFKVEESDEFEGLFTDPRDEDGTEAENVTPVLVGAEPESELEVAEPEIREDLTTDPEIIAESLQSEPPEESMDDLFETEVPSVKAYVEDVIEVVETDGAAAGDEEPMPAVVDVPERAVASPPSERFEDRIEAPGPFAPAPADEATAEDTAEVTEEVEIDEEAVHAEVRQALGASEDREALASLSAFVVEEPEEPTEDQAEPVEVQPVVPPPPIEPVFSEAAGEGDEVAPAAVVADVSETTDDAESAWGDEEEGSTEEAGFVTPSPDVPDDSDSTFTEQPFEEPDVEETTAEEDLAVEPVAEEPAVDQPVVPPPVAADDPLTKSQPIMVGTGDPFTSDDTGVLIPEVLPQEAPVVPASTAISVSAQDNQLHLQLKGSGAITEIGQVRAIDIEVPVPGDWVGNRKVTLQLRLTLTPAEDEDG